MGRTETKPTSVAREPLRLALPGGRFAIVPAESDAVMRDAAGNVVRGLDDRALIMAAPLRGVFSDRWPAVVGFVYIAGGGRPLSLPPHVVAGMARALGEGAAVLVLAADAGSLDQAQRAVRALAPERSA